MRKVLAPESAGTFFYAPTIKYMITKLTSNIPEDRQE